MVGADVGQGTQRSLAHHGPGRIVRVAEDRVPRLRAFQCRVHVIGVPGPTSLHRPRHRDRSRSVDRRQGVQRFVGRRLVSHDRAGTEPAACHQVHRARSARRDEHPRGVDAEQLGQPCLEARQRFDVRPREHVDGGERTEPARIRRGHAGLGERIGRAHGLRLGPRHVREMDLAAHGWRNRRRTALRRPRGRRGRADVRS